MIKFLKFDKIGAPASQETIKAFQAEFSLRLPEAFIDFCLKFNGGLPNDENSFYAVPESFLEFHKEYAILSKDYTPGVTVDFFWGLAGTIPVCDVRSKLLAIRKVSAIKLFPISEDLFGNGGVAPI